MGSQVGSKIALCIARRRAGAAFCQVIIKFSQKQLPCDFFLGRGPHEDAPGAGLGPPPPIRRGDRLFPRNGLRRIFSRQDKPQTTSLPTLARMWPGAAAWGVSRGLPYLPCSALGPSRPPSGLWRLFSGKIVKSSTKLCFHCSLLPASAVSRRDAHAARVTRAGRTLNVARPDLSSSVRGGLRLATSNARPTHIHANRCLDTGNSARPPGGTL